MIIKISAKCSDLFSATLIGDDGKVAGEYDGYVPDWMPGEHYGDYVILNIDVQSGQILNWRGPSKRELGKTFEKVEERI